MERAVRRGAPRVRRELRILFVALLVVGCDPEPRHDVTGRGLRFDSLVRPTDPAPLELYPTRSGTLPVRHYPASSPRALILIHGSGSHGAYLAPLARAVAASGAARVFTPDLRGHGVDPERRGDTDYVEQLEDDLADLIQWTRESHGAELVIVGGHSSGGGLAARFVGSRHRESADAVLLLAPFLGHDAPTTRRDAGGWARPRVARIVLLSILDGFGITAFHGMPVITFQMPEAVRDGTETLSYSFRLNTGYAPRDYRSDLASTEAPLLVVVGAEDEAFYADRFDGAVRAVRPEARVEVLDGASHLGLVAEPAVFPLVSGWIAGLGGERR